MAELPRPSWENFLSKFSRRWSQGEHVFINGQTGSGKTELLLRLMELRKYGVVFVTKPRDPIFTSPYSRGFVRQSRFRPKPGTSKIMLSAPRGDSTQGMVGNQQDIFAEALNKTYADGGWTIGVDETLWIANRLKLASLVGDASYMGRALGLTVISATQRPAHIPVIIPQSATHALVSKSSRASDLKTLSELGGDTRDTLAALQTLRDPHDFLYVDTAGKMPLQVINTRA